MTISVITPCLNAAATVERTLTSVARQSYPVMEYIFVDGQSTDTTRAQVEAWSSRLPIRIIVEPPQGVYAAMNTGLRAVRGDVVSIVNADDYFYDATVLARVVQVFAAHPEVGIVYGDIVYADAANPQQLVRYWRAGEYNERRLRAGWAMPHPAVFVRRTIYEQCGLFNESFTIAGDYEIMLRWLLIHRVLAWYEPAVLTVMSTGGLSGGSFRQRLLGWRELRRAWQVNALPVPRCLIFRRVVTKLTQFLVRREIHA